MQARFISPDPFSGSAQLTNPQSLNRYSYVQNQPTVFTDPSGLTMHAPVQATARLGGSGFADIPNYVAEDEARYEENLATTYAAIAEAHAINEQLQAGTISVAQAASMVASNPNLAMTSAETQNTTGACGCTLQIRGRDGDHLSAGDPLRFPSNRPRTLGASSSVPDRWGWQIEISGTVSDDVSTWHISQNVEEYRSITYERTLGGTSNYSGVDYGAESLTHTRWASQPKGGHQFFAIDAPGLPNAPFIISGHSVQNFTTFLTKGNMARRIEWSIVITVTNRKLTGANFYPHHMPLQ